MHILDLPLHSGKAPAWLFKRMEKLSSLILDLLLEEYTTEKVLELFSDALWFQAFSLVIGFDWHSSGTTTVTTAAIKNALNNENLFALGGKKESRNIRDELENLLEQNLIKDRIYDKILRVSKYGAKSANISLLDGFSLYHHFILFDKKGNYTIIEQGMNKIYARRYHLFNARNFEEDIFSTISSDFINKEVKDLENKKSRETRKLIVDIINEAPRYFNLIKKQKSLLSYFGKNEEIVHFKMPLMHRFNDRIYKNILEAYNHGIKKFEEIYDFKIGEKTMLSLTLIAELVFNPEIAKKDPVKYSFAHGGKDSVPYPINKKHYDQTIAKLEEIVQDLNIDKKEKYHALKRLSKLNLRIEEV